MSLFICFLLAIVIIYTFKRIRKRIIFRRYRKKIIKRANKVDDSYTRNQMLDIANNLK